MGQHLFKRVAAGLPRDQLSHLRLTLNELHIPRYKIATTQNRSTLRDVKSRLRKIVAAGLPRDQHPHPDIHPKRGVHCAM